MSEATCWAKVFEDVRVGDLVFVTERNPGDKPTYRAAFTQPQRTNMSNEPIMRGWLGETNGVSETALYPGRVVSISAKDHDRVQIRRVADDDADVLKALEAAS